MIDREQDITDIDQVNWKMTEYEPVEPNFTAITNCRVCDSDQFNKIIDLGNHKVSTFGESDPPEVPLSLCMCGECGLVQLEHNTNPSLMWNEDYGYRSGVNETMRNHLEGIVTQVESIVSLEEGDIVVDIGSNDGTLLGNYPPGVVKVGFEPSKNVASEAAKMFLARDEDVTKWKIVHDFFKEGPYKRNFENKAKVITAISMFYDLEDPNEFLQDINEVLDDDGIFVVQQNYVKGMIEQGAVDNICHEHLEYYSLGTMEYLLDRNELEVFDVSENNLNGGSFRTLIQKKGGSREISDRVQEMRDGESHLGEEQTYLDFAETANNNFKQLKDYVDGQIEDGKKVYIYGASTRGGTLLQGAGIDHEQIIGAAERNPAKWGKTMMSTGIPMVSEEEAREDADVFVVLPWFFRDEFVKREDDFIRSGGEMCFPLPKFEVVKILEK